jgi:amino-acid N-acetyltransferase
VDEDIQVEGLASGDEVTVRALLTCAGLPVDDLTLDKFRRFRVARAVDGSVAGAIGLEPYRDVALLRSLVVHPAWRDVGVGAELTRRLEAHAGEQGIHTLYLLTGTAEAFFRKLGYHVV